MAKGTRQNSRPKYVPPVSNEDFLKHAKPMIAQIGGHPVEMEPREFSSGSVGYNASFKVDVLVNGKVVKCQVGLNVIVCGSKPGEAETAAA